MAHENAGKIAKTVINKYFYEQEFRQPSQKPKKVKFGTSGHRGELGTGFCALHAAAIAQAVADMHAEKGIKGPVLVGGDTRLMSGETSRICAEVLAANDIPVILALKPLPTPVFSHEIMAGRACACLNGTASHNPPADMGLKYNPSTGGPAGSEITGYIETLANKYMENSGGIRSMTIEKAMEEGLVEKKDLVTPYVEALSKMIDFDVIKSSGLRIGIHALGGASVAYYEAIAKRYLPNLELVDSTQDPTFGFIPQDHDGKIRMDPSSQYPMSPLLDVLNGGRCDFVGASDPDADRFGVATKGAGLLPPNHALSIALKYLFETRTKWPAKLGAGRTLGTTHLIDRICKDFGRPVDEVNVGFKYFVEGIRTGRYALAGEESAGMSLYGWTTEKDGILAVLLMAEIMARTETDLGDLYAAITARYGKPYYRRVDVPVTPAAADSLRALRRDALSGVKSLGGEAVLAVRDTDGVKIYTPNAWVLARPSGTEPIAKLYAESFNGPEHLDRIIKEGAEIFGFKL